MSEVPLYGDVSNTGTNKPLGARVGPILGDGGGPEGGGGGGAQAKCLEHVCVMLLSLYSPGTCNPSGAVTLPNIGVP